ncbi:MAG TPA: molybdopterin-dependent oxidoreductase, partial [Candidatus Dormibacteraeota bacterium]|nr:molybdopterin-dependent oxidoreductase [Candidatus Dormibacteraeota bacterium]
GGSGWRVSAAGLVERRTICPYCGVGCGVIASVRRGRLTGIRGDPDHPTNRGGLCSKGQRLAGTVRTGDRLLYPTRRPVDAAGGTFLRHLARTRVSWDDALADAAARLREIQEEHGRDAVAFYLSGQLLTEDYYVANKLVKGFLGTNNVDTNSRLCMASAAVGYKMAFGSDAPPGCYEDADHAMAVLLIGSNAAETHPIVFGRLQRARARTGAQWVVVDPRRTPTAEAADIHLQIRPGSDVALLLAMLHVCAADRLVDSRYVRQHTAGFDEAMSVAREWTPERAADVCGVDAGAIRDATRVVWGARAALSMWCQGLNQATTATDRNLALLNLHLATGQIGRVGAGPFSLTGQANAMGGREVGGMATELAAHRNLAEPADREEVERFWGSGPIAPERGLTATELVDALLDGRLRAVWIAGTNPVASLPDAARAEAALRAARLVVVQDLYPTETTRFADVLLPAAGFGEKTGALTSSERRVALAERLVDPPGEARPDWEIFAALGRQLGHTAAFSYRDAADVFDEHAELTAGRTCDMSGISHERLRRNGTLQWPCPTRTSTGTARRYVDGRFATPDGRARLHPTPWRPLAEEPDATHGLSLVTVRTATAWHTQSKTGRVAEQRRGETARLDVHPADAEAAGVKDGDVVELVGRRGRWRGRVRLSDTVRPGTVAAPFHAGPLHSRPGWVNRMTLAAVDPRSRQPELKHAAVRLERARPVLDGVTVVAAAGNPLAAALRGALKAVGVAGVTLVETVPAPELLGAGPLILVTDAVPPGLEPLVVDASGRLVDRDGVWAVGPGVRTALGLGLTDDPDRLARALTGEAGGARALTRADLRLQGARATFAGGDPDASADDDAQEVDLVSITDTATGLRVRWRLAGGQVLGVAAEGPADAVQVVADAWLDDLGPAEVRGLLARPQPGSDGVPIEGSPGLCVAPVSAAGGTPG